MTRKILILKNTPRENPGLIEILLKEHNLNYQIRDFSPSSEIQPPESYSAIIVLGGPESANDRSQKILSELELIYKAVKSGIPYLGICLGLQTLVKAMNGIVLKSKTGETGFRDPEGEINKIRLTKEGRKDKLFKNLPDVISVFQLHGETVMITPRMKLLATGRYCRNQVVKFGKNAYGIQSHLELTNELLESWIMEDADLQKLDAALLRVDFESLKSEYQNTGRQLFNNFFMIAGLI
jgi:GMP synthase (glutamine-hydrolysing)